METKTYFASSVQAAMDLARRELGADAMLVTSRPSPEDARVFGRLEVTFAFDAEAAAAAKKAAPEKAAAKAYAGSGATEIIPGLAEMIARSPRKTEPTLRPTSTRGDSGLEDIRQEISALRAAICHQPAANHLPGNMGTLPMAGAPTAEIDGDAVETLCQAGLERETARKIVAAAGGPNGIVRELTARIPVATFAPLQPEESRTLALVGPSGRGKSTSLVKIAVKYGLANRIPTRIYMAGAHGVGASEQMARYAAIMGVPFQPIESFDSLNLALNGERWKGLILIDTPGSVTGDRHEMESMTRFFSRRTDIERHLVIRAEARSADMNYMLRNFSAIQPSRLLFTGIDEVRGLGSAVETMIASGIGAAFFGNGTRIPDDLEEVSVARLVRSLWKASESAARAA